MLLKRYFSLLTTFVFLSVQRTSSSACDCKCENNLEICEYVKELHTNVDVLTGDREKWSEYFGFVQFHHRHWKEGVKNICKEQIENALEKNVGTVEPTSFSITGAAILQEFSRTISELERANLRLEGKISDVEEKLDAMDDRANRLENDLIKEKESTKTFERDLLKAQYATLTVVKALQPVMSLTAFRNLVEELNKSLGISEEKDVDFGTEKYEFNVQPTTDDTTTSIIFNADSTTGDISSNADSSTRHISSYADSTSNDATTDTDSITEVTTTDTDSITKITNTDTESLTYRDTTTNDPTTDADWSSYTDITAYYTIT